MARRERRHETAMIDELLIFLEVDAETETLASTLSDLFAPRIDNIIEDFYNRLDKNGLSRRIPAEAISALKDKQKRHWLALFRTQFGEEYCSHVRRIAIRHRDIGLNQSWYVASYASLKLAFIDTIMGSNLGPISKRKLIRTLEKYIAIDMALALSTYEAILLN